MPMLQTRWLTALSLLFLSLSLASAQPNQRVPASPNTERQTEETIREAFQKHPILKGQMIILMIDDGALYLAGRSNSFYAGDVAEEVARQFGNFDQVINLIDMRRELVDDSAWEIKNALLNGLYFSPYVNPDRIEVEVEDAIVELTGRVDSRLARFFAEKEAIEAGAQRVVNQIEVIP